MLDSTQDSFSKGRIVTHFFCSHRLAFFTRSVKVGVPAGVKVIVFGHHKKMLDRTQHMSNKGGQAMRIDGQHFHGSMHLISRGTQTAFSAGGKVIVFGHHKKVLDGIQDKFSKGGQSMRIDGSTSMEARKKAMDDFQQKASVRLAVLSITAAGVSAEHTVQVTS